MAVDERVPSDDTNSTASASKTRSRSRRNLLRLGGVAVATALAGCTEDIGEEFPPNTHWPAAELVPSLPVREQTEVLADGIEALSTAQIPDEATFETTVEEYGLSVEAIERTREVLTVDYVNNDRYASGTLHDVGLIAGAYAALIAAGYDSVALGITILDPAPASFGSASIETEWTRQYNEGRLSAAEYGELVATTIESMRRPPDVGVSPDEPDAGTAPEE